MLRAVSQYGFWKAEFGALAVWR